MHQSGRILHQVERNRAYARNVRSDRVSQSINHSITRPSSSGGVSSGWGVGGGGGGDGQRPESAMSLCEIGVPLTISEPHASGAASSNHNISNFPTDGSQLDHPLQSSSNAPTRVVSASSNTSSAPPHIGSRRPPSPYRRMTTPSASIISNNNNNDHENNSSSSVLIAAKDDEIAAQRRTISQLYHRLSTLENHIHQMQIQKRVLVAQNRKYRVKEIASTSSFGLSVVGGSGDRGESPPPALVEITEGGGADDAVGDSAAAAELMLLRTTTGSPVIVSGQSGEFKPTDDDEPGEWGTTNHNENPLAATSQYPDNEETVTQLEDINDDVGDAATADHAAAPLSRENLSSMKYSGGGIASAAIYSSGQRPASAGQASLLDLSERQSCASAQQAAGEQLEKERKLVEQCLGEQASNVFAFAVEVRCEEDLKDLLLLACSKLRQQRGGGGGSRPSSPLPLGNSSSSPTASAAGVATAPGHSTSTTTYQPKVGFDIQTEPSSHEDSQHQWTMSASQQHHNNNSLHRASTSVSMKEMLDELRDAVTLWKDAAGTRLDSGLQLSLTLMQQLRVWSSSCESLVERVERTKDLVLGHAGERPADTPAPTGTAASELSPPPLTISNLGKELDELLNVILQLSRHTTVAVDVVEKNYAQLQSTVAKCHDGAVEDNDTAERGGNSLPAAGGKQRGSLSGSLRGSSTKHNRSGSIWAATAALTEGGSGKARSASLSNSTLGVRAGSAEQRVMKDIHRSVAHLRQEITSLQTHCRTQIQRTLKDSATDEDLLCVYRREIADAALRCSQSAAVGGGAAAQTTSVGDKVAPTTGTVRSASGGRRRQPPPALGSVADDFITVPTTPVNSSSPPPLLQPASSRPGSGTAARPRSTPGRGGGGTASRSGSPLGAYPPQPAVVVPPIVVHLIKCVNSTHIAYLELFFGPVRNHSTYHTLKEQERHAQLRLQRQHEVEAALASVDGGAAAALVGPSSLDGVVFVRRGANTSQPQHDNNTGAANHSEDPAIREVVKRHMNVLPGTYGALIERNVAELRSFPTTLSEQDEQDLANHAEVVQQLLEIGFMWSDALSGGDERGCSSGNGSDHFSSHLRVHHCTDFLELVRRSKPMISAFFFHNAILKTNAVAELQENSASCFADAIRGVVGRTGKKGSEVQRKAQSAQNILACTRLLQDSSRARAVLNWKGLLALHKHAKMKHLLLQGLRTIAASNNDNTNNSRSVVVASSSLVEQNEQLAGNLRRLVAAFYTDLGIKLEAEQRLLKSSLRITTEAVWADFLSLLQDSGDLCLASGVNIEVLDVLGPSYHTLVTEGLKYIAVPSSATTTAGALAGASVVIPRGLSSAIVPSRNLFSRAHTPLGKQLQQQPLDSTTMHNADASTTGRDGDSVLLDDASSPWPVALPPPRPASPAGGGAHSTTSVDVGAAPMWMGLCISKSVDTLRNTSSPSQLPAKQLVPVNRLPPGSLDGRLRPLRPHTVAQSAYHSQQAAKHLSPQRSTQRHHASHHMFKLASSPSPQPQQSVTPTDLGRKMYTTSAVLSKENPWIARKK
ncbi:Hypothetical protein, putative [Bodo saltans]|uniref:Uncharacterized protein n=1 Tax=Bodo saltans TaxID=75058 RepID=A0A0S4JNI4_BODSA|nr:Hypothetical protein, putative [Bodo saltans]|eukprot:CUG90683.1 Hypothetical protein, putative [Bodo saltans]